MSFTIKEVHEYENMISVIAICDTGERIRVNFPLDVTEEDILNIIGQQYDKMQKRKTKVAKDEREALMKKLKGKKIDAKTRTVKEEKAEKET